MNRKIYINEAMFNELTKPKKKKKSHLNPDKWYEDKADFSISSSEGDLGYSNVVGDAGAGAMICEDAYDTDIHKYIESFLDFLERNDYQINPRPAIELNAEEQDGMNIKTGYYDPDEQKVVVFVNGRHIKDILRSFAHEMVHHMQNLQNPHMDWGHGGDLVDDDKLRELEGEAYHVGNILFREWTEELKKTKKLNESMVVESPDSIESRGITWRNGDAIPFMLSNEDGKFHVGKPKQTHIEMLCELFGMDENDLYSELDDENFDEYVDTEATGRYWPGENIISFWKTPLNHIEKLIGIISRLSLYVDFDFNRLIVDWWDAPFDSEIPYRWFTNGTFSMLYNKGIERVCEGPGGVFTVIMGNGQRHNLDVSGNPVEPAYSYSRSLHESTNWVEKLKSLKARRDPDGIEDWGDLNEATESDVDLSSFKVQDKLNPKIWVNDLMDSRVRLKLLDIAQDFIEFLDVNWVKPEDAIIVGSIANYNWSRYSDIDLHIVMDYSKVDERKKFVENYFQSKKKEWNDTHDEINIFGYPVELYVQDKDADNASSAVYSIYKNKWIKKPVRSVFTKKDIDSMAIKKKASSIMTDIEGLEKKKKVADGDEYKNRKLYDDSSDLIDSITSKRKTSLSKTKDEMNTDNLVFKVLRRNGYLDKLFDLRDKTYDKMNSLE